MIVTGKTRVVGIWGCPVEHSLSPVMQNAAIEALNLPWSYLPFLVHPDRIGQAVESVRALNLIGANVTVPLKELVAPLLDRLDDTAARIGSVNTIVNRDGVLWGYSTDGAGLLWDLKDKAALPNTGGRVLVLGAGGSARAVVNGFAQAGFVVSLANRTHARAERLASELGGGITVVRWQSRELSESAHAADLIVNTTTIGMHEKEGEDWTVFAAGSIKAGTTVYDIVYAPRETPFVKLARQSEARAFNGLGMLVRQGAISLHLWTGLPLKDIPVEIMERALSEHVLES
jgi:shikimate dehydrogenase